MRIRLFLFAALVGCSPALPDPEPWTHLLPRVGAASGGAEIFTLGKQAAISVAPPGAGLEPIAELLAADLRASTGFALPVQAWPLQATIHLQLDPSLSELGSEGYVLAATSTSVVIRSAGAAGLFYGTQTLRQLLPAPVERSTLQPGPWRTGVGTIRDAPRFAWRGLMIDVARHFFTPAELRRYIDVMARYKLNRLHLHLTDDQGWRLQLDASPALTAIGGSSQVGGGAGGFYTKAEYADLVAYAAARFVTVVPEIDLPGHIGAALSSIPSLNCNGTAPPLYTGTEVGLSSLCAGLPATATFVHDVIGELATMTPGPFLHVGGDEAKMTSDADYRALMSMVRDTVKANGKQLVGWEEVSQIDLGADDVVQHWLDPTLAASGAAKGAKLVLSPAKHAYLDMKYDVSAPADVGTFWAGFVNVPNSYDWDPGTLIDGVAESSILGVEGAIWTETVPTIDGMDALVFPRLLGLAELGWSPAAGHDVRDYLQRLGAHGPRLSAHGIGFFAAPQVSWAQ